MFHSRVRSGLTPFCKRALLPALLLSLWPALHGCQWSSPPARTDSTTTGPAGAFRVVQARQQPWPTKVRVQGTLVGDEEAVVGAKVVGRVKEVLVDRGTPVKEGHVLARLEPEEFDLRVRQAEAQVAQIRAKLGLRPDEPEEKLDRMKAPTVVQERALVEECRFHHDRARTLLAQQAVAIEELQKHEVALRVAEARFAAALNTVDEQIALLGLRKAELALARQHQADAVITAPFQGVVQERHVSRGVFLEPGHSVVTVVRTHPLRFRAGVPEREAFHVRESEEIVIHSEGQAEPTVATISRVSPSLDLASRSLMIEADVANADGRLRAGLFAQADIVVAPEATALAVPAAAVTEFAGIEKVWLVRDGQTTEHRVWTGRRERGFVEILKGLRAGNRVLADAAKGRAGPVTAADADTE
jgi:RND family efflux transporter MFP subunit